MTVVDPTKHFLPDYHHWGEMTIRVEEKITIPIRRVQHVPQWTGDPPFLAFGCTWHHFNSDGELTQEKFEDDLEGAIEDFANGLNDHDEFVAYPITHKPPTAYGMAYHDWVGASHPFDLRCVISYEEQIPIEVEVEGEADTLIESGLKFAILTLMANPEALCYAS